MKAKLEHDVRRMRKFLAFLVIGGYRRAHGCATTVGFNFESATDLLYSLLHARDADSDIEWECSGPPIPFLHANSMAFIAYFQEDHPRPAVEPNLGAEASRMALDVGETFLYDSEQSQFRFACQPFEARRYF
jgi:hypothetical protein